MSTMRWFLLNKAKVIVQDTMQTYGYITNWNRNHLGLKKTHANDAYCIAGNLEAEHAEDFYSIEKTRCHNRQTHKMNPSKGGKRKENQAPRYVRGLRLFDRVKKDGKEAIVTARKSDGRVNLRYPNGTTEKYIPIKKTELVEHTNTRIYTRRKPDSAPTQG